MIIDAHAHISDSEYGNIEIYKQQMNAAGINQGIVVPGGMVDVRKMTDYITGKLQPEDVIPNNEYVKNAFNDSKYKVKGFVCVDPHDSNSSEILDKSFKDGFKGLKLSPITHQFSFLSKSVINLMDICGKNRLPVYSHVLYNPGASTSKFVNLAKQFPKVNFILGHMGFGPADQEALEATCTLDNFYLETSLGNYLHIEEVVKKAGASKVIFGSEFPLSHPKIELQKILLLNLSQSDLSKILGGNIVTLLDLK